MNIVYFDTYEEYEKIFPKDENGREINIYRFKNLKGTGVNLYYPNVLFYQSNENILVLPTREKTMSLNMSTMYEKNEMKYDYNNKETNNIVETPLFFFIYNTENYFHFLYDALPNLISYQFLKKRIPALKLLINYPNESKKKLYDFVQEFYELLGLKEDLIYINENDLYKDVYITDSFTHSFDSNLPPRKEIYNFFDKISSKVKLEKQYPEKIYISRRTWTHNKLDNIGTNYTQKRKCVNEDELVELLKSKGFEEVFTENLNTIEKIGYFKNAKYIIGAIGGGIANVLFSAKETKLLALISPGFLDINYRFKYSLENVNVKYFEETEHSEKGEYKKYMRVNIKDTNKIGEIEEVKNNEILISYTEGNNTGWSSNIQYKQMWIEKENIIKIDNGLNSPFLIDIDKIKELI